jgi:phosphoribosyl 1,2-cyclic phosphate phosphodiesterase
MKVTILGCGASGGVPRIGGKDRAGNWEKCDPTEPKNRRMRASILVEQGETRILVDTSPDLRQQCLTFGIDRLDAVLFTHDHADHTHGVDDLRGIYHGSRQPIDVYGNAETIKSLVSRFDYAFAPDPASGYKPFVKPSEIDGPFQIMDIPVQPFSQNHGKVSSLGFRFGGIAYSTDLVSLPDQAYEILAGVDTWIVDALKYQFHPTHANVEGAVKMIERVKPRRAVLTHMTSQLDYRALLAELPIGVEPAFDGLILEH